MTDVSQHFTSIITPSDAGPRITFYFKDDKGHLIEMVTHPFGTEHQQQEARIRLLQAFLNRSMSWHSVFPKSFRASDYALVAQMLMMRGMHKLSQPHPVA